MGEFGEDYIVFPATWTIVLRMAYYVMPCDYPEPSPLEVSLSDLRARFGLPEQLSERLAELGIEKLVTVQSAFTVKTSGYSMQEEEFRAYVTPDPV